MHPKSDEQRQRLSESVKMILLFRALDKVRILGLFWDSVLRSLGIDLSDWLSLNWEKLYWLEWMVFRGGKKGAWGWPELAFFLEFFAGLGSLFEVVLVDDENVRVSCKY